MDRKKIQSNIPYKIISEIHRTPNIQFKKLKDILNISSPTLTIHLKALLEKNQIIFEKKGREKYYRLDKKYMENPNVKIETFRSNHISQIDTLALYGVYDKKDLDDEMDIPVITHYTNIVNSIGTYFLFTLFKSLETGDNWFNGFDKNQIALSILDSFCRGVVKDYDNAESSFYIGMGNFDKFFKQVNLELGLDAKKKTKIMFKNMQEMYYYHFNALKKASKKNFKQHVNL